MSRRPFRGALAASVLVLSSVLAVPAVSAEAPMEALVRQFHQELNAERVARGRAPLPVDPAAATASSAWAGHLGAVGALRHSGGGRAEIIGTGGRTGEITAAWVRSTVHRDLVLDAHATGLGVGVSCDGQGRIWVVAQLTRSATAGRVARTAASSPAVDPGSGLDCAQASSGGVNAIRRLHVAFLGGPPADGAVAAHAAALATGGTLDDVARQLAASPEHAQRYGRLGDAAFVDAAYHLVHGRRPDPTGAAHWREVARGKGRHAVLLGFAHSEELKQRTGWR